ncbi:superinfection immunity protein [Streptococcus salivarius]|uniref:superinfection immunity protein n=1 Tax=Streptococcus salivarius TaxID=1304 RepID=UPI000DA3336B|nr:superinfection immunity protein [Streptococcus salivarius]SQF75097.1 Uncharacterised protein [Streptococcus salivarius]
MKQQDWIDFFQAVNGRNPSIQEMAEAAQKGEFVRETPKQTVEVTETVSQKETVETKQDSEVVEPAESAPSTEVVETAEKNVDSYDVAEEPLVDSSINERQTFQTPNLGQESPTTNFQEQINPIQGTTNKASNPFAEQANASFQQTNSTLNEPWKNPEKKSQTNLIMIAIATIPVILWALGMILLGIASDDLSTGLITALLSVIINFPLVVLLILPALLNKTDKKWPIFILSFLLGWTFIGWIILLAVSINTNKEAERIRQQQMMMQMAGQQGSSDTFNPFQ